MEITKKEIRTMSRLGMRGAIFGILLPEMAAENSRLKILTADLALLSGMDRLQKAAPDTVLNMGIAEQNMIGTAAGLALGGYQVIATTYASFVAVRSLEFVRQFLSNLQAPVTLIGSASGMPSGKSGVSHLATEDLAFIRPLPNIVLLSPADALEAVLMTKWALSSNKPCYIRLTGGLNTPAVFGADYEFKPGEVVEVATGENIAILATGLMVAEAVKTRDILATSGITPAVYHVGTLNPLDTAKIATILEQHQLVITVEEHNIVGGLGSAIAEVRAELGRAAKVLRLGMADYMKLGTQDYMWEQIGITACKQAEFIQTKWAEITAQ